MEGKITFDRNINYIPKNAFRNCKTLQTIALPDGIKLIDYFAFKNCSTLTSIEIPVSIKIIRCAAFEGCSSLTSIEIPDGIELIDACAFYGCSSLTTIDIPNSITSINDLTFCDCSELTSIEIPDSVTSIGEGAFSGCKSLKLIEYKGISYTNCYDLFDVLEANNVSVSSNAFSNSGLDETINPSQDSSSQDTSIGSTLSYTSTDEQVVTPYVTDASSWGANIVSNVYE